MEPEKNQLRKSLPLTKVDEAQQQAWGTFTAEVVDSDNEIADFEYQTKTINAWSQSMFEKTKAAGQEPSYGNVRFQHTSTPVGKVIQINRDETAKTIGGGTYIHDADAWAMIQKGILTGFSFGGSYDWRKCNECGSELPLCGGENFCAKCGKNVVARYGASIVELSVCDQPAVPVADILHIKADGARMVHKAGSVMLTKAETKTKRVANVDLTADCFAYVGDPDDTSTWHLPIRFPGDDEKTKSHIRNALARFDQTKGIPDDKKAEVKAKIVAAAKEHGIEVDEEESKSSTSGLAKSAVAAFAQEIRNGVDAKAKAAGVTLRKGLWEVADFAEALLRIAYLRYAAVCERDFEGDDSAVPDKLSEQLASFSEIFLEMAEEEVNEMLEANKAGKVNHMGDEANKTITLPENVQDTLTGHLADTAAHHETVADLHKAAGELHKSMADSHKAAHEHFSKAAGEGGEHEDNHEAHAIFHKAAEAHHVAKAAHHEAMSKAHAEQAEGCAKACKDMGGAEKSAKALDGARSKKAAIIALAKSASAASVDPSAIVDPAGPTMSNEHRKAFEAVQREWLNSDEYKQITLNKLRQQTVAEMNEFANKTAQRVVGVNLPKPGEGSHAVTRGSSPDFGKAAQPADTVLAGMED